MPGTNMYSNLYSSKNRVAPLRQLSDEDEPTWMRPAKSAIFFVNILIWLAVCAVMALGIFGILNSIENDMTNERFFLIISAILVGVGTIGFTITLLGCGGIFSKNRTFLIIYTVLLAITIFVMLIFLCGIVAAVILEDNLRERTERLMNDTFLSYDESDKSLEATQLWDSVQQSFKCCGIKSYVDWSRKSFFATPAKQIPLSCCRKPPQDLCETAVNEEDFYSKAKEGCHTKIFDYLKSRAPVVIIALCISIVCSIINVILGSYIAANL